MILLNSMKYVPLDIKKTIFILSYIDFHNMYTMVEFTFLRNVHVC